MSGLGPMHVGDKKKRKKKKGVSKSDYLAQMYGDAGAKKKKKKKKKKPAAGAGGIIDDNVDWRSLGGETRGFDASALGEDGPALVAAADAKVFVDGHALIDQQEKEKRAGHDAALLHKMSIDRQDGSGWGEVKDEDGAADGAENDGDSDSDASVSRRVDSDSDEEPVRRLDSDAEDDSDQDMSPARPGRVDSDSDGDMSPVRRQTRQTKAASDEDSDSDMDVQRGGSAPPAEAGADGSDSDMEVARPPAGGSGSDGEEGEPAADRKTGLHTGKDFSARVRAKADRAQAALLALPEDQSGKHAETVVRDKSGRRMTREEIIKAKAGEDDAEDEKMEWGSGLVQQQEMKRRRLEAQYDAQQGFARSADDTMLNAALRDRERWGDPMMQALRLKKKLREQRRKAKKAKKRAKKAKKLAKKGKGGELPPPESSSESEPEPQYSTPTFAERPRYKGEPWPNRFNIRPGYRWDGVVRGIEWETTLFKHHNNVKNRDKMAYKWSSENM